MLQIKIEFVTDATSGSLGMGIGGWDNHVLLLLVKFIVTLKNSAFVCI